MNSNLDLNLLKVLLLLSRHKQLKKVSKILGKSEASVSKYLGRLREQFADELFVLDVKSGFEPTEFMKKILPEIEYGLELLDNAVDKKPFCPRGISKTITIAYPQYNQFYAGHVLLKTLMDIFPNARFDFPSWDENTPEKILNEDIDLGIQFFNDELPKSLYQKVLGTLEYSIVIPKSIGPMTFDEACKLPFILPPVRGWKKEYAARDIIKKFLGVDINIVAQVDNICCVLNSVKNINGATVLSNFEVNLDKFDRIPIEIEEKDLPKVAAIMKLKYRRSPFHNILIDELHKTMPF